MNRVFLIGCILASIDGTAGDWTQWRGSQRNGVVTDGVPLLDAWPESGPKLLWRSETIPSGDDGGHGSVVVADGKTYMSLVWHDDEPSDNREINALILRKLGYRNLSLPESLIVKMEKARESLSPRLRGRKLNEWAEKWVSEKLSTEQAERNGSWVVSRFKKGRAAIPYNDLRYVAQKGDQRFKNDAALQQWMEAQPVSSLAKRQLLKAIPNTVRVAKDVVVCLDAKSGRRLWKTEAPGEPTGRKSSSTPSVTGGRLFAAGSTHVYCMDAKTGKQRWAAPLPKRGKGPASSLLVDDCRAFLIAGQLTAYDTKTGELLWENSDVRSSDSSPVLWLGQAGKRLICSERRAYVAVDPETGKTVWKTSGGGNSTPTISGDWMVVYSKDETVGLAAYRLAKGGAKQVWTFPMSERRSQSSPVIYGGHVYLTGGEWHMCVELATGKLRWKESRQSTISSPVIADGKLIALEKKGSDLVMIDTDTKAHRELGKARIKAMWCPSPVIVDGKLYLRMDDNLSCYDLRTRPSVQ
ncbi:MAG: PQQ-like beta-propeller repeat protein [Verrucomicrobia bacterium]|nr:PQQ-like beta-propeller repeat protein [Verrucomicrobiota bacterium]